MWARSKRTNIGDGSVGGRGVRRIQTSIRMSLRFSPDYLTLAACRPSSAARPGVDVSTPERRPSVCLARHSCLQLWPVLQLPSLYPANLQRMPPIRPARPVFQTAAMKGAADGHSRNPRPGHSSATTRTQQAEPKIPPTVILDVHLSLFATNKPFTASLPSLCILLSTL